MLLSVYRRHSITTDLDGHLPLHLEAVGLTGHQEDIYRESGYPYYHWMHTIDGSGEFVLNGVPIRLTKGQGILLKPNVPHSYTSITYPWVTWYITFGGALAQSILNALGVPLMIPIHWNEDSPIGEYT